MEIRPFAYGRPFRPGRVPDAGDDAPSPDILALEIAALLASLDAERTAAAEAVTVARQEGFAAGVEQGRDEGAGALLMAVDALHDALGDIDARLDDRVAAGVGDIADLALAAAGALAGHAVAVQPLRALDEALDRVLPRVVRGTALSLRVHPDLIPRLTTCLAERAGRDRRQLSIAVVPDDTLAPGDGVVEWDDGGVVVDAAARRAAVLSQLAPMLAPALAQGPISDFVPVTA